MRAKLIAESLVDGKRFTTSYLGMMIRRHEFPLRASCYDQAYNTAMWYVKHGYAQRTKRGLYELTDAGLPYIRSRSVANTP